MWRHTNLYSVARLQLFEVGLIKLGMTKGESEMTGKNKTDIIFLVLRGNPPFWTSKNSQKIPQTLKLKTCGK